MLKIEEYGYPACVRVNTNGVGICKQAAYGKDMKVLLEAEVANQEETVLAFLFEKEMDQNIFLLMSNGKETGHAIALKLSGDISEVIMIRQKIAEIGKVNKLISAGLPLKDEYGILILAVFETKEKAEEVLRIARQKNPNKGIFWGL